MLYETVTGSLICDAGTFLLLSGLFGVAGYFDSTAMAILAFIMSFLWIIAKSVTHPGKHRLTPQQAADWLAEKFNVRAKP